jgi:hypothetical protein
MRSAIAGLLAQPCIDPEAPCPIVASLGALRSEPSARRAGRTGSPRSPRSRPGVHDRAVASRRVGSRKRSP